MNKDMHMLFEAYRGLSEQQVPRDLQQQYPDSNLNYYPGTGWIATPKTPNDGKRYFVTSRLVRPDSKPQQPPTGGFNQVIITPAGHLDLNENILFDFDKATLKPAGVQLIQRIAQKVLGLNNPNLQVNVVGYTDLYGGASYNQQLSMSRAQAVSQALQKAGVSKVSAKPGGMKNPKVSLQHNLVNGKAPAEGIAQQQPNRRVEIEFNPPLPKQIMQQFITNVPQTPSDDGRRSISSDSIIAAPGAPMSPEDEKTNREWMQRYKISQ
jgi:outer membrane protein OmpA-like peptidoglycan-associated protein